MPVEAESPSNTAVPSRLSSTYIRKSRSDIQSDPASDFFAQLLQFQTPRAVEDSTPPEPTSESSLTSKKELATDSTVGNESSSDSDQDRQQDSKSEEQSALVASATSQTANPSSKALEQDFIASTQSSSNEEASNLTTDERNRSAALRTFENAAGAGRYDPDQKWDNDSIRSTGSEELKKARSKTSPKDSAKSQHSESDEGTHTQPSKVPSSLRRNNTDDNYDQGKRDQSHTTEDLAAQLRSIRTPNPSDALTDLESATARRKALRTDPDHSAPKTSQDLHNSGVPSQRLYRKGNARDGDASRGPGKELENAASLNSDGSRIRRRNDRNQARARGVDTPRELTDKVAKNDSSSVQRPDTVRPATIREATMNQAMDSSLTNNGALADNINSPTPVSNPSQISVGSQSVAPSDPVASSRTIQSTSKVSRSDPQSHTAAVVPAAENASSITTPTRSSSTAPTSAGSRLSHYQETKLVHRVLRGMEQLADGGGQVRLRLHPPELGSLQMSLRIEGTAIFAEMQVETTSARDALMKNLPVLKERLSEQGMQIEHFDVRADGNFQDGSVGGNSQGTQSGGDSGSNRQSSRYVAEIGNRLTMPGGSTEAEISRRWTRTHGALDFEA